MYLFLASKEVKNYTGFKWNLHRLLVFLTLKPPRQILLISKSHWLSGRQWNRQAYISLRLWFNTTIQSPRVCTALKHMHEYIILNFFKLFSSLNWDTRLLVCTFLVVWYLLHVLNKFLNKIFSYTHQKPMEWMDVASFGFNSMAL